ncbi:unnamed protein product, partial [Ixodes persulcatus]
MPSLQDVAASVYRSSNALQDRAKRNNPSPTVVRPVFFVCTFFFFFLVFESYPTPLEEFPSSGSFPEDDRFRRAARPLSDADNGVGRRRAVRRRSPLDDEGGESHQTQGH